MMTTDTGQTSGGERSRFEGFGRKVDEQLGGIAPKIEEELRKVISYLNDEVVPQVRRESSTALRSASDQLARLAEHLDRRHAAASSPTDYARR